MGYRHPKQQTFGEYLKERGTPDLDTMDVGPGPSGRVSERTRRATEARLLERLNQRGAAQREFQALIDSGSVIDPSGGFAIRAPLPTTQVTEVIALHRQAAELRELASRGMKPRAYTRQANALEARAVALEE